MCERFFVTRNADRLIVLRDIILASEGYVTMPAAEMFKMPKGIFCLCIFRSEYELEK